MRLHDSIPYQIYDAIGRPLTLRRYGVLGIDGGEESFGLLDGLSYSYVGALPSSITRETEATEFFGQPGAYGTTLGYNAAGLLTTDTGRQLKRSLYNRLGQAREIEIGTTRPLSPNKIEQRVYTSDGKLISVSENQMLNRIRIELGHRTHIGQFIFAGGNYSPDTLMRVDFPGGYFDGSGVHWMLSDAIGSVELVVDGKGRVEQHTGYYPYGEPWREPVGQPYLFGGKERRRFASLGDSDFHARFLTTATALWQAPDVHAGNRPWISPFVFCSANPIRRIDPTGMDDVLRGSRTSIPPGIKLFDDEEEYKRLVGLNVESKEEQSNNPSNESVESNKDERSISEKVQIGMDALNTSQGTKVNIIEIDAKKKTGIKNGDKAIKAYGGSILQKYIKLSRGLGLFGSAVSVYNTYNTWDEYTENGGDDIGVEAKLIGDGTVAIASNFFGLWGFAGGLVYNVADIASGGFGTDQIIEEQKKKKNGTNNP